MKIISGFRHPQKEQWNIALNNLKESGQRLGHEVFIAELPSRDCWLAKYEELFLSLCWKYKLLFMIEQIKSTKDDLLWVDGDCLIAKKIDFNEVMQGCDIGVTLRDIKDRNGNNDAIKDGYINSGVIFIRNNEASRKFLEGCRKHLMLALYDQEAFNAHLLKFSEMTEHGQVFNAGGAMVKLLDCREFNNFYFDETFLSAKIQHFKSKIGRDKYKELYGVTI